MDDDDLALVEASKAGDIAAFETLVKRHDGNLLRIAQHLLHNREDAEDVVQDAFLKAFQHLHQFQGTAKFSTWLIRIAMNQALMKLRKRNSLKELSVDDDRGEGDLASMNLADWSPNPEELCKTAEFRQMLREALQELRPNLRTVFVLRDIQGLSLEQTAEALDTNIGTVKARARRARLQLRERLSKYLAKPEKAEDEERQPSYANWL